MRILGVTASSFELYTAFESIASTVAAGGESSISFTSIPGTYQHLQIRLISRFNAAQYSNYTNLQINSDTGTNYAWHILEGTGSTTNVGATTSSTSIPLARSSAGTSTSSNIFGAAIVDIHDYASTTKNKTVRTFGGTDGNAAQTTLRVGLYSGLWLSTSAITSLQVLPDSATFLAGTTVSLYGIKGA